MMTNTSVPIDNPIATTTSGQAWINVRIWARAICKNTMAKDQAAPVSLYNSDLVHNNTESSTDFQQSKENIPHSSFPYKHPENDHQKAPFFDLLCVYGHIFKIFINLHFLQHINNIKNVHTLARLHLAHLLLSRSHLGHTLHPTTTP